MHFFSKLLNKSVLLSDGSNTKSPQGLSLP